MINTTIYDIKEYMCVFVACLLMFGNAILVLDNYLKQYDSATDKWGDSLYVPIIPSYTGSNYFDAFLE